MPDVDFHGWSHRPKALGGTDPVPINLPWARGVMDASQSVTATTELAYTTVDTNDYTAFRWDDTDPAGILILQKGLYACFTTVRYPAGSYATARQMYQTVQPLSSGVLGGLGAEFGENDFSFGQGQSEASLGGVTTIAKANLTHMGIQRILPDADDPMRLATILQHDGSDYTVSGLDSASYVVKLADPFVMLAPAPDVEEE